MTQQCQFCRKDFKTIPSAKRATCSRPCYYRLLSLRNRGVEPHAATSARLLQMRKKSRDRLRAEFGDLSIREINIIRAVYWAAYNRGYQRAKRFGRLAA